MLIGNKIYELRKQANLSQEQLSEKINVTRQTISNWETDQTVPDLYQAKDLARVLNISLDELMENYKFVNKNDFVDLEKVWEMTSKKLKHKLTPLFFETWIKELEFVNFDKGTMFLSVPLEIQIKHLKSNYNKLILDTIKELTNIDIKRIDYVLKTKK